MVFLTLLRRQVPNHKLQASIPGLKPKEWRHHPSISIVNIATAIGAMVCGWYIWRMSVMQDVKITSIANGYDDVPMKPTDQIPVFLPRVPKDALAVPATKPVLK